MNDASFFLSERDEYLKTIERSAQERFIPIIKPEVGQFLKVIIRMKKPQRILELGTAIGYSTIWMAKAAKDIEIVTIELDEERAQEAKGNFHHYHLDDRINLKIGDALEILPFLRRKYDLIFLDAAKGQYIYYLDYLLELLSLDGVIIADNVLYRGFVRKKGPIKHKRRTMVNNLKKYLKIITNHPLLDSTIIPIGDGIAMSVRRGLE